MKRTFPFLVCLSVLSIVACKPSGGSSSKAQETPTAKEPAVAVPTPEGFGKAGELYPVLTGGKFGYINGLGKMIIEPQFSMASRFSDDLAVVLVPAKKKCGYIDREGKLAIDARFDSCGPFSEGYAAIKLMTKAGVINKKGEITAEPHFERVSRFHDGLAAAVIQREARGIKALDGGYINPKGTFVIYPQFDANLTPFSEGVAGVRKVGQMWSFIDRNEKAVVAPQFFQVGQFSEGLAGVMDTASKWGFIDKTGKYVITPKFQVVSHFSNGLAGVYVMAKKKWGFIDKTGNMVIPEMFDAVQPFEDGIAFVQVGTKAGYINKEGKYVWKPTE